MRRKYGKYNNLSNQNNRINIMEKKRLTITITDLENGTTDFEVRNEGLSEFELIGILVHVTETRKQKLNTMMLMVADLEKEMD